jgi:dihydrofolate reductase
MRKIVLSVAVSLDGYIEGPNGEYDWCPPPSKEEMDDFVSRIDVVFMGRKSYEMAGSFMLAEKMTYVFSNSLNAVKGKNVKLLSGDVLQAVDSIRKEHGKDIWLWGGASLTSFLMNHGLVDEMWLAVVPVVLGSGKPLFESIHQRHYFSVLNASVKNGYLSVVLEKQT